jgi:hypothetical protein
MQCSNIERAMLVLLVGFACTSRSSTEDGMEADGRTSTGASVGAAEGSSFADEGAETTRGDHGTTTDTGDAASGSGGSEDHGHATTTGEAVECQLTLCQGKVYDCGDCQDNDGDGLVDAADPGCWGPCDDHESGWHPAHPPPTVPGMACVGRDCFFDQNTSSSDDECYWALNCDPLEPLTCTYDPDTDIPNTRMSCEEASAMQSATCGAFCGPLVPNGCDCFGCCEVSSGDETHTVYLGSYVLGELTCGPETIGDPELCHPCTQVPACLNPCEPEHCEICIGQSTLPAGCQEAGCPEGVQPCLPEHESGDCPSGMACITGCCIPFLE